MDFSPLNTEAFTVTFSRVSHIEGTRMPMDVFTDTYRFSFEIHRAVLFYDDTF